LGRYRDLLIGIVLNMSCNAQSSEFLEKMLAESDIIPYLLRIMGDERGDWPTNGAVVALLQYAHEALSSREVLERMEEAGVYELVERYLTNKGYSVTTETKHNLHETLQILVVARAKNGNILKVLRDQLFAASA